MIKDFVKPQDRINFYASGDPYFEICTGCGRTSDEVMKEDECTVDDLEDNSIETNSGLWYCHRDCYRDSH